MRIFTPLIIWTAGILVTALAGALTNAVNGHISPLYFVNILGWGDMEQVPRAAIAQGIFEGAVVGLLLSTVFTVATGLISRFRCSAADGLRYLGYILATVLVAWGVGGAIAVGLARLSPEFYQNTFRGVPEQTGAMLRYAWVGGSIVGLQLLAASGVLLAFSLIPSLVCVTLSRSN
ncbi:MAG: hypothetical protein ACFB5Z_02070 [Elainellaceae cyanobacterium]